LHYQYGRLDTPGFAGGGIENTHILTFQHASGWKYGDNYFFTDFLNDTGHDGFNDTELCGEYYANFSMSKISGSRLTTHSLPQPFIILWLIHQSMVGSINRICGSPVHIIFLGAISLYIAQVGRGNPEHKQYLGSHQVNSKSMFNY
jgi:hypothetical protein